MTTSTSGGIASPAFQARNRSRVQTALRAACFND